VLGFESLTTGVNPRVAAMRRPAVSLVGGVVDGRGLAIMGELGTLDDWSAIKPDAAARHGTRGRVGSRHAGVLTRLTTFVLRTDFCYPPDSILFSPL